MTVCRWVALIDVGFLDGAQRRMTLEFDAGDDRGGYSTWRTYRATLFFFASIGFLVFLGLSQVMDIDGLGHGTEWRWLFVATGAMFAGQYMFGGTSAYFNARRQFPRLAVANGAQSLLSGSLALVLTLATRRPEAYLAGFAIGNLAVALYNIGSVERQSRGSDARIDKEAFRDMLRFGWHLFPTRIATVTSQSFDRVIVTNALGAGAMAPYGSAARIPEAASEALPLNQTLMPDLTRAGAQGQKEFDAAVDRLTRVALMVGCGLIFIPCAFAAPFLQAWLQDKYVPEMAWVMLAVGLYRALETFYSSLALSMIAHGSPKKVFPFTVYNALAILLLMWPVATTFGIVGVAFLRVGVHVVQFVPLMVCVRNWVAPGINLGKWLSKSGGTVALSLVFASAAVALWAAHTWAVMLLAPFFVAGYLWSVDRLGLAPVPEGVKKRARWAFPA